MEDRTGLAAFEEIFIRGEYDAQNIDAVQTIVDVGANIGVAGVYFLLKYPHARLYAIEANHDVCNVLQMNLAQFPSASVHRYALCDVDGEIEFHIHPSSSLGSSLVFRTHGESVVRVPSRTLDTFMREQSIAVIDLMKFDIEGAEDRMLTAISNLNCVRHYIGELHADLMRASIEDIRGLFRDFTVNIESLGGKRYILEAHRK